MAEFWLGRQCHKQYHFLLHIASINPLFPDLPHNMHPGATTPDYYVHRTRVRCFQAPDYPGCRRQR